MWRPLRSHVLPIPVLAERGGTQLRTPRPSVQLDTRERNPFDFLRFNGWSAGVEKKTLKLGDYSVATLEDSCVVERKIPNGIFPVADLRVLHNAEVGVEISGSTKAVPPLERKTQLARYTDLQGPASARH
jgi:hypothetical protein